MENKKNCKLEDFRLNPIEPLVTTSTAASHQYDLVVPYAAAFVASKGTTFVKEAYTRTDHNSRHSFDTRGEEIRRIRSLASIQFAISVFLILHSDPPSFYLY
jgi:hypothetical protein